jgi:hypothetical protein
MVKAVRFKANRLKYHLFFKSTPHDGEYCNSKFICMNKQPPRDAANRPYLAIIRCGARHALVHDSSERNFDIALNLYAEADKRCWDESEYVYTGGISKYKAALQFISEELLGKYEGFIFLDDDLKVTYSQLSRFLAYCSAHRFGLAQPSLTPDSSYSHKHLVNVSERGWRPVHLVEVMCPYFSRDALRTALYTFDLSDSSWGLDFIWPRLFSFTPVVVDEFTITHIQETGTGGFYRYMHNIGVSPRQEMMNLKSIPEERLQAIGRRARRSFQRK